MSKNKTLLSIELANIIYKSDRLSFSWKDAERTAKAFEKKFYQKGYRAGDNHGFNQGYWVGKGYFKTKKGWEYSTPDTFDEDGVRIKDLIVNNPRAKDRIKLKEIDRQKAGLL